MSGYDDPRWYEEQRNNPTPPKQPASDDFEQYPFLPNADAHTIQPRNAPGYTYDDTYERRQRIMKQIVGGLALVIVAFIGGWFSHQFFGNTFDQSDQSRSYEQVFQQAWTTVDQNYVDRKNVNYQKMAYAAIQAMVDTLQDKGHSRFMDPGTVQSENQQLSGKFTGIGISLRQDQTTKQLIITFTIPKAPAEKAGLKPGDVITAVNGNSIVGKDVTFASNLITGKANTTVTLTIQRAGVDHPLNFPITRAEIDQPNVFMHYSAESHIAHIQIVQFSEGTANQVKDAVNQAKGKGATKLILDLRNNPGGYLNEAVDTASLFIKSGNVLLTQDSSGLRTPIAVNGNPIDTTDQIVVLTNGYSASAAEILTGALKDNHRATIIGEQTYGTGTVLNSFPLSDGSAVLLGTQEWLTPNGQFIRGTSTTHGGIVPDIEVKLDPTAPLLSPNDENQQNLTVQQILSSGDTQLAAAMQHLLSQK